MQLYYIYLTGEQAAKYEPLNDYPCIRRAERSRDDYTYDFAVDRMLDLMACLHVAGPVQGKDYDSPDPVPLGGLCLPPGIQHLSP